MRSHTRPVSTGESAAESNGEGAAESNGEGAAESAGESTVKAMLEAHAVRVCLDGREVLSDVGLQAAAGEWVTLVGPNGAGKSLLLSVLAGIISTSHDEAAAPSSGVYSEGESVAAMSLRNRSRKIAYVPQQPAKPTAMTVIDYVLLGRTPHIRLLGTENATDRQACEEVIERLDLADLTNRSLETLSGGELQRCHLARAISQTTPIVILDEPTTALDIGHEQQALELIDELRKERRLTVVAAMHDLTAAAQYSHSLVLLAAGKVVAAGTPDQVLKQPLLSEVYGASVEVLSRGDNLVIVPLRPKL